MLCNKSRISQKQIGEMIKGTNLRGKCLNLPLTSCATLGLLILSL